MIVIDSEAVITNVNVTKHEVNILCRVRKTPQDPLQYCLFINPNGTMLQISPGVGSGKYVSKRISTCNFSMGLSIKKITRNNIKVDGVCNAYRTLLSRFTTKRIYKIKKVPLKEISWKSV